MAEEEAKVREQVRKRRRKEQVLRGAIGAQRANFCYGRTHKVIFRRVALHSTYLDLLSSLLIGSVTSL